MTTDIRTFFAEDVEQKQSTEPKDISDILAEVMKSIRVKEGDNKL